MGISASGKAREQWPGPGGTSGQTPAKAEPPCLSVAGVSATEGGGGRVEVLVTVEGCHAEPCRHLLNVTRTEAGVLEDELRSKLLAALTAHHPE